MSGQVAAIAVLVGLFALLAWASWIAAIALVVLAGFAWVAGVRHSRSMATERQAESICSFARSFDRREACPWVVRAVYEMYSASFPIRADDKLDAEDMDFDAEEIAERAGRSLECVEANPLFGKVATAGDLVLFLSHQPRLADHASSGEAQLAAAADHATRRN